MTTITVSLPDPLGDFVNEQVARGGYASASEFISYVVRQAQAEAQEGRQAKDWVENLSPAAKQQLDEMLLAGLNSGPPIEVDDAWWEQKIDALKAKYAGSAEP